MLPRPAADIPEQPPPVGRLSRGAPRESAILVAALELLVEAGYDRMSMDAVATRAHASKATIYRRWPGKRELVLDAVRSRASYSQAPPDTGSLRGDLVATLRLMATGIGGEDAALMAGVLRVMRCTPELADCVRTGVLEQKRHIGLALVGRAIQRGELPPDADPEVLHEMAPALVFFRMLVTGLPVDDAFFLHVTDDVLIPLLARGGHPQTRQEKQ